MFPINQAEINRLRYVICQGRVFKHVVALWTNTAAHLAVGDDDDEDGLANACGDGG